mmetsp:Transcript_22394/g.35956  ORF Transcript_22394/g.35956 Transcript_22394/m.35956 type:complete len:437 (-) Transcript_22394:1972-3282(-)
MADAWQLFFAHVCKNGRLMGFVADFLARQTCDAPDERRIAKADSACHQSLCRFGNPGGRWQRSGIGTPCRDKTILGGVAREFAVPSLKKCRHHSFGHPARPAGFIDDQNGLAPLNRVQERINRQWRQPSQIHNAHARHRRLLCQIPPIAKGHDGDISTRAVNADSALRDQLIQRGIGPHPGPIARRHIAHRIKRNGFNKDADPVLLAGQTVAFAQHHGRLCPIGRARNDQPRNVTQHGQRVVIVKMTAKPLLIAKPCDPQNHRVRPLPVRKEGQRRRLPTQLIFGIVQIGEELNFGHGNEPVMGHADGQTQNALLIQQRVDDPPRAKARVQLLGDAINATFAANIFAHDHGFWVGQHQVRHGPVDQAGHGLRLLHLRHVRTKGRLARLGTGSVGFGMRTWRRHDGGHDGLGIRQRLGFGDLISFSPHALKSIGIGL